MKKAWLFFIILVAFGLRIFKLGEVPPSLYWDEASLGYNGFAVATTLHDEHGEFLPPTRFMAFGDYKAPGYIYAAAASIKALGLSDFSVRFPSALAGTLLVLVAFLLASELGLPALPSAAFVAISPWALQFSRGAFESNLATFFSGFGIYLFLRAVRKRSVLTFAICVLSFVLSMYSFNTHRVFVPLILSALGLIYWREIIAQWRKFIAGAILFIILLLPLAQYSLTREAQLRFQEVAWVNDLDPIKAANNRIVRDQGVWWSNILHNRRVIYTQEFLKHYTDNFKASFLFYSGDENKRLSIQSVGEMYWLDLPFLLIGFFYLLKHWHKKSSLVIFAWLLLAPVPAALARETPHALRTLNLLPIPQLIVALGVFQLVRWRTLIAIFYFLFIIFYLRNYYLVYPTKYADAWQYGYKQMVAAVASRENSYPCVSVTEAYGRPYIYFLLYDKVAPETYWATRDISRDWYGFWYVHGFGKYRFGDQSYPRQHCLYVRAPNNVPQDAKIIEIVPNFVLYEET